jgi:MFS family permease
MTVTSFLSDVSHEMVMAVLPGFLPVIHVAAAALGWIEGASDAFSSFLKLFAGWYSDKIGHRKRMIVTGQFFTGAGLSLFSFANGWGMILAGRMVSWFGRGLRGTLRDAMLTESVAPEFRGRAIGFHRTGDTLGAILGPLLGIALLSRLQIDTAPDAPFRTIFLLSLIPGMAAPLAFLVIVRETRRQPRPWMNFLHSLGELPPAFRRMLVAVGLFGSGDFSPALLILAAATLLRPQYGAVRAAEVAALLYALRNTIYAAASFPIGWLADRHPKAPLLAAGYFCGALTAALAAWMFHGGSAGIPALAATFTIAGIFAAAQDTLEKALPPDITDPEIRGTVYGSLGAVNGFGDLASSALVGTLWTLVSPTLAFSTAGALMLAGSVLVGWGFRPASRPSGRRHSGKD